MPQPNVRARDTVSQVDARMLGFGKKPPQPNDSFHRAFTCKVAGLLATTLYVAGVSSDWRCSTAVSRFDAISP